MASGYSPYEEQNILNDVFSRTQADQHLRVGSIDTTLTQAMENNSMGMALYVGETQPGNAKGSALWRIKKITYDGSNFVTDIQWASGVNTFTKEWDERASYYYS